MFNEGLQNFASGPFVGCELETINSPILAYL